MNLYSLLILASVPGIIGAIVDTEQKLICASENDCYPQVLIPTREWQPIRKGQDIPPGLHVRLNIDTLQREAKILEEDEEEGKGQGEQGIPANMDQHQFSNDLTVHESPEELADIIMVPPTGKIDSYESAVEQVMYGQDETRLSQALDVLVDFCHDGEYGEKLTSNKQLYQQLIKLAHKHQTNHEIVETIYRIIGSSLRNNPQAIKNFLKMQDSTVINSLLAQLGDTKVDDKIQKRILGIIQALLQNDVFRYAYFDISNLIKNYENLGKESKVRFINILQDLGFVVENTKRSDESNDEPDETFSNYLQTKLIKQDFESKNQFQLLFDELTKLHENNRSLEPSSEFMQWLATEVETRKENAKRDQQEIDYDNEMLRRRHEVFGNPNAMRKAMLDEL